MLYPCRVFGAVFPGRATPAEQVRPEPNTTAATMVCVVFTIDNDVRPSMTTNMRVHTRTRPVHTCSCSGITRVITVRYDDRLQ